MSAQIHKKARIRMFRAGFTKTARNWKHCKCPPFEEWRNGKTVVSSFSGKLASVKKNKLTAHTTGMNLTDTMLSERSQTQRE